MDAKQQLVPFISGLALGAMFPLGYHAIADREKIMSWFGGKKDDDTPEMFCLQCSQFADGQGCTSSGKCGRSTEVALLCDVLTHAIKGISRYAWRMRDAKPSAYDSKLDSFTAECLCATIVSSNFDSDRLFAYVKQACEWYDKLRNEYRRTSARMETIFDEGPYSKLVSLENKEQVLKFAPETGLWAQRTRQGREMGNLSNMILSSVKGMSYFLLEAERLGKSDPQLWHFIHKTIDAVAHQQRSAEDCFEMLITVGSFNSRAMELLSSATTASFGSPSSQKVLNAKVKGKCILVSGDSLAELQAVLKAVDGKDINVFTHSDLASAHAYPNFKGNKNLAGNFGGSWTSQKPIFASFPGPIMLTGNYLLEPLSRYKSRCWTVGASGHGNLLHAKADFDYAPLIAEAMKGNGFPQDENQKFIEIGSGVDTLLTNSEKIVSAFQAGKLKRIFVVGGADGTETERSYFKQLVDNVPADCIILTFGSIKFRFLTPGKDFGELEGIPRLFDLGNIGCGGAALLQFIKAFGEKSGESDPSKLPFSFAFSWYDEKTIALLFSLLAAGMKKIRLGPKVLSYFTPTIRRFFLTKYQLNQVNVSKPENDVTLFLK